MENNNHVKKEQEIINIVELSKELKKIVKQFRKNFVQISANWPKDYNQIKEDAELLAKNGWFIIGWLTPFETNKLAEILRTEGVENLNTKIISICEPNNWKALDDIISNVFSAPRSEPYSKIILDCLAAHKEERYILAITAGLTVLECMIADCTENLYTTNIKPKTQYEILRKNYKKKDKRRTDYHGWIFRNSFSNFISDLYADSNFVNEEPISINRHWMIHRIIRVSSRIDNKIESLRILLSIIFIGEILGL